jgi:hypothetical protein
MSKLKDNPMADYIERNACDVCGKLTPTELVQVKTKNGIEEIKVCDACKEDVDFINNLEEIYKYGTREEIEFLLEVTTPPLLMALRKNREEVFNQLQLSTEERNALNAKFQGPSAPVDLYFYLTKTYKDRLGRISFEKQKPSWKMELEPAPKGPGSVK